MVVVVVLGSGMRGHVREMRERDVRGADMVVEEVGLG